jgi:hypothetical protein
MKKLLLFILVLIVFSRVNAYDDYFGESYYFENFREALNATIDSVNGIDSTRNVELQIMINDTSNISILKIKTKYDRVRFYLPLFSDEKMGSFIIGIADSLAKTDNYRNKLLAAELCSATLLNTKYWKRTGKCFAPWQRRIVKQAVVIDTKYCYRYARTVPVVAKLHKCLYDNEIDQAIKYIFKEASFTQHEIEVYAKGLRKIRSLNDTIGYYEYKTKQTELTSSETSNLFCIERWLKDAQANKHTLKEYFDSLNTDQLQYEIKGSIKRLEDYKMIEVISSLDRKCMVEFAPFIDSLFQSGMFPEEGDYFQLVLARMGYEDYAKKQIDYLGAKADSILECIKKLPENKENNRVLTDLIDSYIKLANQLKSIGTQEAYYRLAPALLVKRRIPEEALSIYYGNLSSCFYIFLRKSILNIPLDTKPLIEKLIPRLDSIAKSRKIVLPPEEFTIERQIEELNSIHIDLFFDKDYCEQIYNWMVKNKGKYNIVPRKCEEW